MKSEFNINKYKKENDKIKLTNEQKKTIMKKMRETDRKIDDQR